MLSAILNWFSNRKDGSIVINSPSSSATVSGVVTFAGTSIQTVNGTPLPAQSWSISADLSAVTGAYTFHVENSAGKIDDRTVIVQNVSPNNATVFNNDGRYLTDSAGARWNVVNGVVYKNSATIGFSAGISELIFHNGQFTSFYPGPPSSVWAFNGSAWVQSAWPAPVTYTSFWGMNGHFWGGTAYSKDSQTVAKLVAAGCNTYRVGYAFGDLTRFKNFISAYAAPSHIAVYPVALISAAADESAAYALGYSLGVEMAGLAGMVPMYELPNEYASYSLNSGADGNLTSHYNAALFKVSRGLFRGVLAGIRSIDATTPIAGPTDTWLHTGFGNMLWNGTSPDIASANTALQVRWDLTTWHWYDNMGNIESAGGPNMNVLSALAAYGVPIRLNEYGCYFSSYSSEAAVSTALVNNLMVKWDTKRATYNITGCDSYELYDDGRAGDEGQFGVVLSDASTNKTTRFSSVAAYILAHQ